MLNPLELLRKKTLVKNEKLAKSGEELDKSLMGKSWYKCVGLAQFDDSSLDYLIVYTINLAQSHSVPTEFMGFPVKTYEIGKIVPL